MREGQRQIIVEADHAQAVEAGVALTPGERHSRRKLVLGLGLPLVAGPQPHGIVGAQARQVQAALRRPLRGIQPGAEVEVYPTDLIIQMEIYPTSLLAFMAKSVDPRNLRRQV